MGEGAGGWGEEIGGKESKRAELVPPVQARGTSHASPPTPHSLFPTPLATHATIGATHIARTKARHASCLDRLCPAAPSPAISRSPTSGRARIPAAICVRTSPPD